MVEAMCPWVRMIPSTKERLTMLAADHDNTVVPIGGEDFVVILDLPPKGLSHKERDRLEVRRTQLSAKLDNHDFVTRAPAHVVEQVREELRGILTSLG
jgi:valyl-tRNA synthetase